MEKIIANIVENSYEDNYENGMVGDISIVDIDSLTFNNVKEAIEWFNDTFNYANKYPLEHLVDNIIVSPQPMMVLTKSGFRKATENEIKDFEAGKINLWNVEMKMTLTKTFPVTSEEIEENL